MDKDRDRKPVRSAIPVFIVKTPNYIDNIRLKAIIFNI